MATPLKLNNTLSRKKEIFEPLEAGFVGMYVCGPTVYNPVHLGNCRTFVSFDIIYRYLLHKGFKVRYVRNITDAGHLTDDGEDRMARGARLERLEPMEVAQKYTNDFHDMMRIFNALSPDIEPRATGHILEQIEMVQQIMANGYGYEVNGSVYFDVAAFNEKTGDKYGELSGRKIDELLAESRELKGQSDKRSPSDFAIWMKAAPETLQRWNSPWGEGFPGWHLECSAMSTKYLGEVFDIHGGGNDLKFPHHENEIAQNMGSCNCGGANYWLHTNMLLMNGRKMSKSDGNTITPEQLFTGDSDHISKAYSPMALRFFMLQSHYRSTLDLTDEALGAAEKGYRRLMEGYKTLQGLSHPGTENTSEVDTEINQTIDQVHAHMNDDFNTPMTLARFFELVSKINSFKDGHLDLGQISAATFARLQQTFKDFIFDILGLQEENLGGEDNGTLDGLMQLVIELRQSSRANKDWATADKIRDTLQELKIQLKDGKDGTSWSLE